MPTVVIVGLPEQLKARVASRFGPDLIVRSLFMKRTRGGRLGLKLPPRDAIAFLENEWDGMKDPDQLFLLVLPYVRVPHEIFDTIDSIETLGTRVVRAAPGSDNWPSQPPRGVIDQDFLNELCEACRREIKAWSGAPQTETPSPGEIRFYKKIGGSGAGDKFVRTSGCNHDKWEPAHSADRAVMGIERIAGAAIRTLSICKRCTGGGHWKVRFH